MLTKLKLLQPSIGRCLSTNINMLYEVRIYQSPAAEFGNLLKIVDGDAFKQRLTASSPWGYWRTEMGYLNQVLHVWPYRSVTHRAEVRNELAKNEQWKALGPELFSTIEWQTSHLCNSTGPVNVEAEYKDGFYYYIYSTEKNDSSCEDPLLSIPEEFKNKVHVMGQFKVVIGDPVGAVYTILNCKTLDDGFKFLTSIEDYLSRVKAKTSLMYPVSLSPLQ